MKNKDFVAIRVTPESLRVVLATEPAVGECHINEILDGFLVLNVPRLNKDGSVSKRPPLRYSILSPERFAERFEFCEAQQRRAFVPVKFR